MAKFQPMLSGTITPKMLGKLHYPVLGFWKYDGIRAIVEKGNVLSRRLKRIPNKGVQETFGLNTLHGVDGELIVGKPTDPDCYNKTESKVMTRVEDSEGVVFYLFDYIMPGLSYLARYAQLNNMKAKRKHPGIKLAPYVWLHNEKNVLDFEKHAVKLGYEGIMLRDPHGPYKLGRSTVKEGTLLKLKRTEDSEAKILEVYPRMKNNNKLEKDERGYAKRSSKKEGKAALPEVGGYKIQDLKTRLIFYCGTGKFTKLQRQAQWANRWMLPGKILKYRFQPAGVKVAPRFPRALGFRSRLDF